MTPRAAGRAVGCKRRARATLRASGRALGRERSQRLELASGGLRDSTTTVGVLCTAGIVPIRPAR